MPVYYNPAILPGGVLILATDTSLYRSAADTLKTDDALIVAGALTAGSDSASAGTLDLRGGASATLSLGYFASGTEQWRQYISLPGTSLFIRDMINGRMMVTYAPGASSAVALATFASGVTVLGPAAFNTTAYVGGALSVDGAGVIGGDLSRVGPATSCVRLGALGTSDAWVDAAGSSNANVSLNLRAKGSGLIQILSPTTMFEPVTSKSADYTATANDSVILTTAGFMTITLPTPAAAGAGRKYTVRNVGSGTSSTLAAPAGGSTIDGGASVTLNYGNKATVISDGTNWWTI